VYLYSIVYAALSFSSIIALVIAYVVLMLGGLRAATRMHESLLRAILRAPMAVFDVTPIGRILNRFSKETNTVDETLLYTLSSYLLTMLRVVGVVIVISYVTPWFLLAMAPVAAFYYYTQNYYIKTSRELQRWESVLRSPIFSHFSETLEGTTSIRAFGMEDKFIAENSEKMDKNLRAYYPNISSNRWLALRLETVGTFIITFAALLVVFRRDSIDPGMGALSLSYALSITQVYIDTYLCGIFMYNNRAINII
jgi:ATP-binding cassette subfamily C (CFTR/MRP) protein 1